jgi:tetratricopeptide (TPR) repeat protein
MAFLIKFKALYTMLHRLSVMARALAVAWLAIAATNALAAPADDLKEAQKLYSQGKLQPALDKDEQYLKAEPRDPQGRFLKGLILTEQKKTQEAIQVFQGLTEDFPELPEPYNNLAVLYASQGNYEKAKSALELASRAYDRALQLDKDNTSAKVKLAMVKDLFSAQKVASRAQAPNLQPSASAEMPKAQAPKPAPPKAQPAAKPAPARVAQASPPPKAAAAPAAKEPAAKEPATKPAPKEDGANAEGGAKSEIAAAITGWARAWSGKDVKGYLAHYASDFEVPKGMSREAWEKQRTERIERPKSIEVDAKVVSIDVKGDHATAKISQDYRSDTFKGHSNKTLKLEKSGGRWLIQQERIGG